MRDKHMEIDFRAGKMRVTTLDEPVLIQRAEELCAEQAPRQQQQQQPRGGRR